MWHHAHVSANRPSTHRFAFLCLGTLFCTLPCARAQMTESAARADAVAHIKVSLPSNPHVIPDTLFGSFLEPIGHSTYGGLWAQEVENPSFEEGLWSLAHVSEMLREHPDFSRASELGLPLPWQPLDPHQGNRYLLVRGDAGNSNASLLVMSLPGTEVGITQELYLPVHRELTYQGSLMLKHVRGPEEVTISLRRHAHPTEILAKATVSAADEAWKTYSYTLTLPPHTVARLEPVDLVISLANDARVQVDNAILNPADAVQGMDPDVLTMARDLQSPVVRFGGNFTSAYNWRDGIGPAEHRVSMINPSWGIPEYNTFGTDEFLAFCKLIHAQPQIALNLGTGTPKEDGEWVKYVDGHWNRGKGGLLWELGNELWGDFQIGYPSTQRIADVTLKTSEAVRAVDPHARLIATGGDEDFFHNWNAIQLNNPKGTFDYLSTHFVVEDRVQLPNASPDFASMAALALPWGLSDRMHGIQRQAELAGQPNVKVAFTEWLMVSDDHNGPNFTNLGGALFAGGFLNMLMRNSDVMQISDMTGILEFGGIWKKRSQVYGAPAYWVLREYDQSRPHFLLDLSNDTPTYSIAHGITRLPEIKDVPYLDCVASEPENRMSVLLTCVNRHLVRSMDAEVDLSAFRNTDATSTVEVTTISAGDLLDENDESHPDRITPKTEKETLQGKSSLHHTFPNASVTIIRVPLS